MKGCGHGVFITGTDTGVGKTVAAAAVLALLRSGGADAVPVKPVQTGGIRKDGTLVSADLDFCLGMSQLRVGAEEYRLMAPYIFEKPCSPHLAAALDGSEIETDLIVRSCEELLDKHEFLVVEGAGGVLAPIAGEKTMLDLMVILRFPVVLVARPALGTLNHTLLSLRELSRAGLHVAGVIFCEAQSTRWGVIEQDNWETIERLGGIGVIGRIPYMAGLEEGDVPPEEFLRLAMEHLSHDIGNRENRAQGFLRLLCAPFKGLC